MSTLEKTIDLLQTIPENKLETVYTFLQFIKFQEAQQNSSTKNKKEKLLPLALHMNMPILD